MRLTNGVLDAIMFLARSAESAGPDALKSRPGCEDKRAREAMYSHCMQAGDWAAWQVKKRAEKKVASLGREES